MGGGLSFITPSDYLITGYGIQLKKFLLKNYSIESIILVDFDNLIFNDVYASTAITLMRKSKPNANHVVKLIKIKKWENNEKIFEALEFSKSSENISVIEKLQIEMNPSDKWLVYFEPQSKILTNGLIPLNQIADISRGIATGHNNFFILSLQEINKFGIKHEIIRPVISNTKQINGYIITEKDFEKIKIKNEKAFLFYCNGVPDENAKRYIEYGKEIGADKRYLTKHRKPWYSMEWRNPPTILATVFSRDRMRFIYNEAGVLYLTAFHGIYPKFKDIMKIKALLVYLNSNFCRELMIREKRTYGGGLDHFQPGDLEKILVLNIEKMNEESIKFLATGFEDSS